MAPVLEATRLSAWYGPIRALYELDLVIEDGGVTALLGANGAGKTTTLRALCNMVRRSGGTSFLGADISRRSTEDIVRMGVAHVPEGPRHLRCPEQSRKTCASRCTHGATGPPRCATWSLCSTTSPA